MTVGCDAVKTALVTGGARRVGRAVALRLARDGFDVAVTYRSSKQEAQSLAGEIASLARRCETIRVDFSEPEAAAKRVANQTLERFDRLDVLVHNASLFAERALEELDVDHARNMHDVNALAPLLLTRELASALAAGYDAASPGSAGRVIAFTDIHTMHRPLPRYAAYAMSKAALAQMVESLAVELAPAITVNALAPGVVAWAEDFSEPHKREYLRSIPLDRAGTPEDAAAAVAFLAGKDASYITGQTIRLDGGRWLQ
ncbi:MAG: SDR family oxidoreductase [Phycisphaeraceae bacterium]